MEIFFNVLGLILILFLGSIIIGGLIDALAQAYRRNRGRPRR